MYAGHGCETITLHFSLDTANLISLADTTSPEGKKKDSLNLCWPDGSIMSFVCCVMLYKFDYVVIENGQLQ